MSAEITDIQSARDRVLREELVTDWGVTHALKKIDEKSSGYGLRTRRRLLTGALRLTRGMAPDAHRALAQCKELLGYDRPVELYVRPDADMNAFCTRSVSGPIIIGVTSRLLETFTEAELRFVLGHELGHALFDHFQIPMPITATLTDVGGRFVTRPVQLKLYLWCRAAEVSADRAGVACAGGADPAAMALFKLASGLGGGAISADLDAFTSQLDALLASPAACADARDEEEVLDCFDTHPYSPLRVRAIAAYAKSAPFARALGKPTTGTAAAEDLERVVERDLAIMEPNYLEDPSEESTAMRRLLYCAGVAVAAANGEIHANELRALRALLGAKHVDLPRKDEDLEAIRKELAEKLVAGKTWPVAARAQIVQHATIIAAADGVVQPSELAVLFDVAEALEIDPDVIDQTLHGAAAPMD